MVKILCKASRSGVIVMAKKYDKIAQDKGWTLEKRKAVLIDGLKNGIVPPFTDKQIDCALYEVLGI